MNNNIEQQNSTLFINLNEDFKIKIEKGIHFKKSIFKDIYKEALKNVAEIVEQAKDNEEHDDYNNIIAFTGERGKGKSSSMISFRNALVNENNSEQFLEILKEDDENDAKGYFNTKSKIKETKFATIEIIDPSLFRTGESLFEIILAQMFQNFQEHLKNKDCTISDSDRREIIKKFQEVFENLRIINSDKKDLYKKDSIEVLSKLATSSNLRKCFKDLVSIYLEKFEKNKDFIVIAIDDFDLNLTGTYEMLEDIRQFLIQPKVILLMACKYEQLTEIVKLKFKETKFIENINTKAEKYLEKLIPFHRKLVLPNILINENKTVIFLGDKSDLGQNSLEEIESDHLKDLKDSLTESQKLFIGENPQITILEAIYKKTNLFISLPELRKNSFLPDNLRSLINLLSTLKKSSQKKALESYIIGTSVNNLNKNFSDIFLNLEKQDIETLNIALANSIENLKILEKTKENNIKIRGLKLLFEEEGYYKEYEENNIKNILLSKKPKNVNIGDINAILYTLSKKLDYSKVENSLFLDLLNIYYALRISNYEGINENIYSFYSSTDIKVFKSSKSNEPRDYINFQRIELKNIFDDNIDNESKFWLIHFFLILGKINPNFRSESESPYFKSIQNVNQGLFSPLAIFSNILFPDKLLEQINLKPSEDIKLYDEIIKWNENKSINLNKLLQNSMFFLELMQNFEAEAEIEHKSQGVPRDKNGNELYFETLYDYFTKSLKRALISISKKYPYLGISADNFIENHPILAYWSKILDNDSFNP
ncbi:hypothetical protein ACT4R0_09920 [Ornithobacterium rhinotracheale]|uniref:hypothetical protein n=1 Tax=Ornithobacterium rhinotracheale TaxID=28251 RepID=UPI004036BC53